MRKRFRMYFKDNYFGMTVYAARFEVKDDNIYFYDDNSTIIAACAIYNVDKIVYRDVFGPNYEYPILWQPQEKQV